MAKLTQKRSQACVLFVEIDDSTKLYEQLGDRKARAITQACLRLLISQVIGNHGRVVKTIGDEAMCHFQDVTDAAYASIDMQECLYRQPHWTGVRLSIRVGFHHGPVIEDGGDLFGDTVNIAARIVAAAAPGQIMMEENSMQRLAFPTEKIRWIKQAWLKGKPNAVELYELVWDDNDQTKAVMDPTALKRKTDDKELQLEVQFGQQKIVVDSHMPSVTAGRSSRNRFVTESSMASRVHLRFEFRPPHQFLIVDQSANGTMVDMGGEQYLLLHDELIIHQAGQLQIGRDDAKEVIYFSLLS